jgi:hypothetical protein
MARVLTFRTSGILAHLAERLGTGIGIGIVVAA